MDNPPQFMHPHKVPIEADSVDSPIVHYGDPLTAIHFTTSDGRWGRITFERLDSLRVSRGESDPYPPAPNYPDAFHWVTTISDSAWLRERYNYEQLHYGKAYNFGGNVDEMLEEYCHYVFSFHDQFVEAIAAGIWFETDNNFLGNRDLDVSHPLKGLVHLSAIEHFEGSGIRCFVRRNPMQPDEIDRAASLCSQTILEIGAELGGSGHPDWTVTRRVRNGIGRSYLRSYFGNVVESYADIPSVAEIRLHVDRWLAEVRERRQQMGKQ
ncbi:MAG: hypothetical protein U0795_11485 [Pirellulales bacterium]